MQRFLYILWLVSVPCAAQTFDEAPVVDHELGYAAGRGANAATGTISLAVVFARFSDEGAGDGVPGYASRLFDGTPGSIDDFYRAMSFERLTVAGSILPKRYASRYPAAAYQASRDGAEGGYGRFAQEILQKADADVDFSQFDNDGPDGVPDSGDDDGVVDYLVIIPKSVPHGFILGRATGVAKLGFEEPYATDDIGASGAPILVEGRAHRGTLLGGAHAGQVIGALAHELGHALGLPDLYDLDRPTPHDNSAGIGAWGLMGRGAEGWKGDDGPVPFSSYSRVRVGWVGPDNDRLIDVTSDTTGLLLEDLDLGGSLLRIPLRTTVTGSGGVYGEHLLLEHRIRDGQHYERGMPAEGTIVWHVRPQVQGNDDEMNKQLDVICADGLYIDRGYPAGEREDPFLGRDNLDFWDHDAGHRGAFVGNRGDSTDLFDGVMRTRLDLRSNPSTAVGGRDRSGTSGLQISFERQGDAMLVDVRHPRWSGSIEKDATWFGDVFVDGDLTIEAGSRLRIYRGTTVHFAEGTQLQVAGTLEVPRLTPYSRHGRSMTRYDGPVTLAATDGETWRGVSVVADGVALLPDDLVEIRDTLTVALSSELSLDVATAVTDSNEVATPSFLGQNYPNPFDDTTRIPFGLEDGGDARLEIYNALGQIVARPLDEYRSGGEHELSWRPVGDDGRSLAGGVYLYTLTVPGVLDGRGKMLFLGGMANLSSVDEELRDVGLGWDVLGSELTAGQQALGYAGDISAQATVYRVGASLGQLRMLAVGERAPAAAQMVVRRLADALRALELASALRSAESLADALEDGSADSAALAARMLRVEAAVAQGLAQSSHELAQTWLQMGDWLQHLRLTALAARQLGRGLSDFADMEANAQTARVFADDLPASATLLRQTLEQLAQTLESAPVDVRGSLRVLRAVDAADEAAQSY